MNKLITLTFYGFAQLCHPAWAPKGPGLATFWTLARRSDHWATQMARQGYINELYKHEALIFNLLYFYSFFSMKSNPSDPDQQQVKSKNPH